MKGTNNEGYESTLGGADNEGFKLSIVENNLGAHCHFHTFSLRGSPLTELNVQTCSPCLELPPVINTPSFFQLCVSGGITASAWIWVKSLKIFVSRSELAWTPSFLRAGENVNRHNGRLCWKWVELCQIWWSVEGEIREAQISGWSWKNAGG